MSASVIIEVYCRPSADPVKQAALTERVKGMGGRMDCAEDASELTGICLTYEFDSRDSAERAAETLRQLGEHVEGPMDYGV